jgi:hypothetical protein
VIDEGGDSAEGDSLEAAPTIETLDAEIRAEYTELKRLEAKAERAAIEVVESRVRLGNMLEQRRAVTPRGQWTKYLRSPELRALGFKQRKAYDNIDFAYLHTQGFDFARLANMSVEGVRREAHTSRHSLHDPSIAARLEAQQGATTIKMVELLRNKLDWRDRRRFANLTGLGWLPALFEEKVLSGIMRRGEPLTAR